MQYAEFLKPMFGLRGGGRRRACICECHAPWMWQISGANKKEYQHCMYKRKHFHAGLDKNKNKILIMYAAVSIFFIIDFLFTFLHTTSTSTFNTVLYIRGSRFLSNLPRLWTSIWGQLLHMNILRLLYQCICTVLT